MSGVDGLFSGFEVSLSGVDGLFSGFEVSLSGVDGLFSGLDVPLPGMQFSGFHKLSKSQSRLIMLLQENLYVFTFTLHVSLISLA